MSTSVMGTLANPHPIAEGIPNVSPHPKQQESCCSITLYVLCIVAIIVVLLAVFVFLGVWIGGIFYFPFIHIENASLSQLSANNRSGMLRANWDITFELRNRNNKKTPIEWDFIVARIVYGKQEYVLSEMTVPSFYQSGDNVTTLVSQFNASGRVDRDVIGKILEDRVSGSVGFSVRITGLIYYGRLRQRLIRGFCEDVRFEFSNMGSEESGRWLGGRKEC